MVIGPGRGLRSSSTATPKDQSTNFSVDQRQSSHKIRKYEQHGYPDMVGMDTFIFGRSLVGFDEAALGCYGAFSVGAGEVVRGRLVD